MAHVIAVAGKGRRWKTNIMRLADPVSLRVRKRYLFLQLMRTQTTNLNEVLGVEVEATLGDIREEIARAEMASKNPIPAGMSKADYAEFKFAGALTEEDDFDLLVMGRTQGKGCYCFVNGLLQNQLAKLYPNYPFMVVDNEAGMEHISRGILPGMDTAILVSDCSRRGVQAAARIAELIKECDMKPKQVGLIVNRAPNGVLNEGTREEIEKQGLTLLGVVPHDDQVYEYDCDGKPTVRLPGRLSGTRGIKENRRKP